MPLQINNKIIIYIFLFIFLGTLNNKDLSKIKFAHLKDIKIIGLNDNENYQLIKELQFLKFKNCKTIFTQKNFLRPVEINKIFEYLKSSKNQNKNITNSKKFFNVNKLFEKQRVLLKTINN